MNAVLDPLWRGYPIRHQEMAARPQRWGRDFEGRAALFTKS
jgi:hypothetical protein